MLLKLRWNGGHRWHAGLHALLLGALGSGVASVLLVQRLRLAKPSGLSLHRISRILLLLGGLAETRRLRLHGCWLGRKGTRLLRSWLATTHAGAERGAAILLLVLTTGPLAVGSAKKSARIGIHGWRGRPWAPLRYDRRETQT